MTGQLTPIAALDILPDGTIRRVTDRWPAPAPGDGALWRWLHCDRTDPAFAEWSRAHLPSLARSGLVQAETRPRFDMLDDGLVLNLRAINLNPEQAEEDMVSMRLWMTPLLVVSTRYRRMFVIEELVAAMEAGRAPLSTGAFAVRLADRITARIESVAAEREESLDEVEEQLLDAHPDRVGTGETEIALIARSIIKMRRYIAPQREALARFAASDAPYITKAERFALREIANRTTRSVEDLDTIRERLASLRAHIDGLNAARIGRNGFVLSIVAAIFLPLGFLTGLFGVNLAGMPGGNWPGAFAALCAGTAVLGVALWFFFRWKRWF